MFPEVGSSNHAIILRHVIFPQPEGPSNTKNSLLSITRLEFFTATKSPKDLCKFLISISAMVNLENDL